MTTQSKQLTLDELLGNSSLTLQMAEFYQAMGVSPTTNKGITISVAVPYPMFCGEEKAQCLNAEAYESINAHRELFTFVRMYGYKKLEELRDSPYTSIYLWIRINHIHNQNLLIVTHGHGPDRGEAYYRAKTYDEFWDIVRKLKYISDNPHTEHDPIILKQNNQMIGNSYKEWDIVLK